VDHQVIWTEVQPPWAPGCAGHGGERKDSGQASTPKNSAIPAARSPVGRSPRKSRPSAGSAFRSRHRHAPGRAKHQSPQSGQE